jgi:enoyl-CoA hydratase/carnithine racemase
LNTKFVNYELDDGLAVVTINNPPVNALSEAVMLDLDVIIDKLSDSSSLQVVIVTGAGEKAFVAGADIKEFPNLNAATGKEIVHRGQQIFAKLRKLKQPVIAAIHGFALGGGCELALACDIRIASEDARIGLPEVSLGIIPGYGGTQRLPRLIGSGQAMAIICSGEPIKAEEALRIGLVDKVVLTGDDLNEAIAMARKIMSRAPLAVQAAKKAIYHGLELTVDDGIKLEADLFSELCATEDQKEGANAFLNKRQPNFKNR